MAKAKEPSKALLFLGVMYSDRALRDQVVEQCVQKFGEISDSCGPFSFSDFSAYYDKEIGGTVQKEYFLFQESISREQLAEIKSFTNQLELEFVTGDLRPINLDPGYLTADKFVLASAKDFAHRIYIGMGIFAEVTLHFKGEKVKFFSWTYKDYLQQPVEELLLRGRIKAQEIQ